MQESGEVWCGLSEGFTKEIVSPPRGWVLALGLRGVNTKRRGEAFKRAVFCLALKNKLERLKTIAVAERRNPRKRKMKNKGTAMASATQVVHALKHIETGEYICLRHDGREFMACFSDGDTAMQFRAELGLIEHVDIAAMRLGDAPFDNFWLNSEMIGRSVFTEAATSNPR